MREYPYSEDDFMEFGETGLVPQPDGTYLNIETGQVVDLNELDYDDDEYPHGGMDDD